MTPLTKFHQGDYIQTISFPSARRRRALVSRRLVYSLRRFVRRIKIFKHERRTG